MAKNKKHSEGEGIPKLTIKYEVDWLPEDLHVAEEFQEFVKEVNPLEPINTKVENFHAEAASFPGQQFTSKLSANHASEHTKTELILHEEFLEENNDAYSTDYVQEYQQRLQETYDNQLTSASIANKDNELCHKDSIETPNVVTRTEYKLEEEFLEYKNHSASFCRLNSQRVVEIADDQQICKLCQNIYPKESIETHMNQAHCERIYQSELSPQCFEDKMDATGHSTVNDDNKLPSYACGQCNFKCPDVNSLSSHVKAHRKERRPRFACQLCEKRFCTRHGLNIHINNHAGITHNCELCGKQFPLKANLKRHMDCWHTRETSSNSQRYKCKNCDKIFVNRYLLTMHTVGHYMPWKCRICEQKFTATKT